MDPAFGLAQIAPAARTQILARSDLIGAGDAADRRVSLRFERMARQVAGDEFRFDLAFRPTGDGIDLDAAASVLFEQRQIAPASAVIAFAAGNPRGKAGERRFQRLDLAHRTAGVGIAEPELALWIGRGKPTRIGADRAHVA